MEKESERKQMLFIVVCGLYSFSTRVLYGNVALRGRWCDIAIQRTPALFFVSIKSHLICSLCSLA